MQNVASTSSEARYPQSSMVLIRQRLPRVRDAAVKKHRSGKIVDDAEQKGAVDAKCTSWRRAAGRIEGEACFAGRLGSILEHADRRAVNNPGDFGRMQQPAGEAWIEAFQ